MARTFPKAFAQLVAAAALLGGAGIGFGAEEAEERSRVVVLSALISNPPADEVVKILRDHLQEFDVDVQTVETDSLPKDFEGWVEAGIQAAQAQPGTLALFGYVCKEDGCRLMAVEPRRGALASIPVKIPEHEDLTPAFAIAATARETLIGSLFPELDRLVRQGENPAPPPPSANYVWMTRAPKVDQGWGTGPRVVSPLVWFEGGYNGEYAHPKGYPIHGPWLGVALTPKEMIAVGLTAGWMGIRTDEAAVGSVTSHRFPISMSFRLVLSLGPARVSIAPLARVDVVMVRSDPATPGLSSANSTEVEAHVGGMTAWYLPLPFGFDVMVGAGVCWTLYAEDYKVEEVAAAEASSLRISWVMGASWSLL